MAGTDTETAEALFKLVSISGSIESLNLNCAHINATLREEFWKAVGQSKTLNYLNISLDETRGGAPDPSVCAKAVAMNAKKNGNLKCLVLENWFTLAARF